MNFILDKYSKNPTIVTFIMFGIAYTISKFFQINYLDKTSNISSMIKYGILVIFASLFSQLASFFHLKDQNQSFESAFLKSIGLAAVQYILSVQGNRIANTILSTSQIQIIWIFLTATFQYVISQKFLGESFGKYEARSLFFLIVSFIMLDLKPDNVDNNYAIFKKK